ncbi:MAG: ABC transporter substrate-binding protein [Bacillota bacterium]
MHRQLDAALSAARTAAIRGVAAAATLAVLLTTAPTAAAVAAAPEASPQKLQLMLDWFPNPDHVPVYLARESGIFRRHGLEVDILVPADPNDPVKLAAAGRVDAAISYQPTVSQARAEGVPVRSIGVLIEHPLNTIMTLETSGIKGPKDLAGRRVGYSVAGFEEALLGTVLRQAGVDPAKVQLINVNFNLAPALLSGQVDAVIGAYKNYESVVLEREGARPVWFDLTEHGVPDYYELVVVTGDATLRRRRSDLQALVVALDEAIRETRRNPVAAFEAFMRANPELDRALNEEAFRRTLPEFATSQEQSSEKWRRFHRFLLENGVVRQDVRPSDLFEAVSDL